MNPLRTLNSILLTIPVAAAPLVAGLMFAAPARAQTDQAASLLQALSLVSGRLLIAPMMAPRVTQDGNQFHVRIPLPRLSVPPDAAIQVDATPLPSGAWDITSFTLPPVGTLVTAPPPGQAPQSVQFTIGQQTAHAHIDPTLTEQSPYAIALSDLAFHVESTAPPADLTIGQLTLDGTLTGEAGDRMTSRSRGEADNWKFSTATKAGTPFVMSLRSVDVTSDIHGLGRGKAEALRQAAQAMRETQNSMPPVPGQPAMTPAMRSQLQAIIDASPGLMTGMKVQETFHGLHFDAANGNTGDIGEVHFALASETTDDRVAANLDVGLNDIALAAVPAQFAPYVPHRISVKADVTGIPPDALRNFMRQAMAADATPESREADAMALLKEPGADAAIQAISIESGPMQIQGSARVRALPDGTPAFDVHLTAHGLDAMMALIQSDPRSQQILPMLFLAKGLGRQQGDTVIWDINFAHGRATVNGVPMGGQKSGGGPGYRPPANR